MAFIQGKERLQGTHQEAQKSRTTTLPRKFSISKSELAVEFETTAINRKSIRAAGRIRRVKSGLAVINVEPEIEIIQTG
jgi:hypothetical protein